MKNDRYLTRWVLGVIDSDTILKHETGKEYLGDFAKRYKSEEISLINKLWRKRRTLLGLCDESINNRSVYIKRWVLSVIDSEVILSYETGVDYLQGYLNRYSLDEVKLIASLWEQRKSMINGPYSNCFS